MEVEIKASGVDLFDEFGLAELANLSDVGSGHGQDSATEAVARAAPLGDSSC